MFRLVCPCPLHLSTYSCTCLLPPLPYTFPPFLSPSLPPFPPSLAPSSLPSLPPFPPSLPSLPPPRPPESALERAPVDESVLLMKFYQLSLGSARQLLTAAQGELPFEVNEQEALIVHYLGSLFVLGRSGTGKTTIFTHRLLRLERMFLRAMGERGQLGPAVETGSGVSGRGSAVRARVGGEGGRGKAVGEGKGGREEGGEDGEGREARGVGTLRQVIVTLSSRLCAAIRHHVYKVRRTMLEADAILPAGTAPPNTAAGGQEQEQQQGETGEVEELLLSEEAEEKLVGDLPESLDEVQPDAYPLVLTFKKLLNMVNATLARPFQPDGVKAGGGWHGKTATGGGWKRGEYRAQGAGEKGGNGSDVDGSEYFSQDGDDEDEEEEEEDEDEEDEWGPSYHQSHWHRDRAQGTRGASSNNAGYSTTGVLSLPEEVDYDRFESLYWPHFNTSVTRKFDALLVYKEFFSHIKGSLHALRSPRGRLSQEAYVALSHTRTSSFDEAQREVIYGLYSQYERMKRQRRDHDLCDYVYHVHRELARGATRICTPASLAAAAATTGTAANAAAMGAASRATNRSVASRGGGGGGDDKVRCGPPFQYVYVDEVQDLTQAQIAILCFLCANTSDGFVFAGDTAQTIARGVDFRFQDIRRLFYELFLGRKVDVVGDAGSEGVEGGGGGGASSGGAAGGAGERESGTEEGRGREKQGRWAGAAAARGKHKVSGKGRRMLEEVGSGAAAASAATLTVVRLADSVVRVLLHFFPHAVDRLAPEFSLIDGEAPVFLDAMEGDDIVTQLFGKKGAIGGGGCEFGAEKVILVRDAESCTELVKRIGSKGLVLSVHECKGLEFHDALVYNFFSGSPMASSWRLLYHYMRDHSLIPSAEDGSGRWQCPSFDPKRHNLLCSELKQLYVVLTRARQRLWIYEEDEGARRPAMDLWGAMGVVAVKALTADLLMSMHTESSPEGWHKRGTKLFNAAQFEAAVLSFERAGDEHSAAVARAALLQQTAKRLQGTDPKKASKMFQDAADAFLKVDKPRDAARCLISAGKMKQAGEERWSEVDEIGGRDVKEEGRGGDVYRDRCVPPMWVKSGECYELAAMAEEAAQCFAQVWEGQVEEGMRAVKVKQNQQGQQLQQQKQEEEEEKKWKQRERLVIRKNAEFLQQAAMLYYRKKNTSEVMIFVHQLPSLAKKRQFLERRDFFGELLQIEITEGNFQRAAEMMLKKGDMVGAARMFLGQKEWGPAFECAMGAARVVSMWANQNKGWPLNVRERKQEKVEKQEVIAETRKAKLPLGLGKEDEGKRVKVKAENGEAVPNAWEARADADESETEVQGKIDAPEGGGKQQKAETQEKAEKQEGVERNVGENIDATMDALETAVALWVWERKDREQGKDVKDLEEGSSVGLGIQGLGGVSGREGGEVDEREGLEAFTLLWLRDFHALASATGRGRQVDSGGEEMDKWWQLLIRCRADELLGMVGAMGKGALGGESAGQAGVVPEEGEEEEEDLGLGERSLAAEVLVSWKGLLLSIQRAKASLSHHASTSLPRSSATPSAPILPSPAKPAANQPSRPSPGAAAAVVTLRPEWQAVNQGAPQQLQQQEQAQKQKHQEELPFEVEWREVKVWWGRWSERVAAMVSALQRLQRRRELPSYAPWLDATFHLLAVSSPASSSSSHSTSHVLASSSAQSFLVGLSSAHWLNPVQAAVSHLPDQGTRGEVAREAAARAGAIYWARQASEMVKECAAVMQQAMRSLEKGLLGRRERGAAGDKKRARELHLQLELWVEIHALLQFAIDLCGGGRQEQNLQQGEEQSSQVQGAGRVGEEGGIAQMAGDVEIWKEQQERATLWLLLLLFPVTSPLPRSVAFVWCYWDVNGFVSFPVFLSLAERAAVHTCAAITNLENLVIPTSLASLHLEGQHYSNLCTHMLMWSGVAPAERGSLFLRLLVLVAVSVCNVDRHHGHEFFSYLVDHLLILFSPLDRLPNPLISTLPPKLYYDLKNMFRRDKPAPGYRVPLLGGNTENAADAVAAAAVDEEEDGGAGDGTVGEEGAGAESGAGADSDSTTEAAVAPQSGESLEQGDEWGGDEEGKAGTVGGAGKHVGKELKNAQLQTDEREEVDGVKIALRITQQLRSCLHQVDMDAFLALIQEGVRQLKQLLQQGGSGTGQGQQERKGQGRGWSEEEAEKHEQLLEEALDAEESLAAATSAVHHSHAGHASASVSWLHSTAIGPLSNLLSQHKALEHRLKQLLHSTEKEGASAQGGSGKGSGRVKQEGSSGVQEPGGGKGKGKKGAGRSGGKDGGKGGKKQRGGRSRRRY
ncbi:unnamed protein product [Closterium sp. NIES-65]|nr:unnamed protein product [Closterium sp. NIES-65]